MWRTQALLVGMMLTVVFFAAVPAQADQTCNVYVVQTSCTFSCASGNPIGIRVYNTGGLGVNGVVTCGSLHSGCYNAIATSCSDGSCCAASDDDYGLCTLLEGTVAQCGNTIP